MTRLPDPDRSRAVLIGCSRYQHLEALPAVVNNLFAFRGVLTDPAIGGFTTASCTLLEEPREARGVFETLQRAAQEAEDTLLVYFCGHGLLGERNELHLALADAERDFLPFTALAYDSVRAALAETRARNRVVILDCCFAGRAIPDMASSRDGIIEQTSIEGTYILAAAPSDKSALAPEGATYTAFTGVLIELLRTGIPNGPELITLDALFPWLRSTLSSRRLPQPRRSGTDTVSGLALTRNPAHRAPASVDLTPVHGTHPHGASTRHDAPCHQDPVPAAPAPKPPLNADNPRTSTPPTGRTKSAPTNTPPPTTAWAADSPQPHPAPRPPLSGGPSVHPFPRTQTGRPKDPRRRALLAAPLLVGAWFVVHAVISPSSSPDGNRLIEQVKRRSGGLTLTVTRVAAADFNSTRVELTVTNGTAKDMNLPLDFGNSSFTDDNGHSLPASEFFTGTEWRDTIPAHQYRRVAVGFERRFPGRATVAVLVLKFSEVPGLGSSDGGGITVRGIKLGPG